ncbi:hypothetical protein Syun_019806 [Stephania yunnanensis]|uniref:NAD(P)-binding domain-containing protein n=1 Tax=Stephania yunnanensis TaxID=152371 RepID=A0AAP0IUV8_9MAGN
MREDVGGRNEMAKIYLVTCEKHITPGASENTSDMVDEATTIGGGRRRQRRVLVTLNRNDELATVEAVEAGLVGGGGDATVASWRQWRRRRGPVGRCGARQRWTQQQFVRWKATTMAMDSTAAARRGVKRMKGGSAAAVRTGAAGFIASNVTNRLIKYYLNYKILELDELDYCLSLKNLNPAQLSANFKFVKGDLASSDMVNHLLISEDIDTIMHFAAEAHVDNSFGNYFEFTNNNLFGTHVLDHLFMGIREGLNTI